MQKEIEAILFDMGGTLRGSVKVTEAEKHAAIQKIIDIVQADAPVEDFTRMLAEHAQAYKNWAERTLRELSEADLWTKWMLPTWPAELIRANAVTLNQLYRDSLSTRTAYPETYDVILSLYRRGYRLGLVSNTTSSVEVPALLKDMHIIGCFETIILSTVIGKRKPDPNILLDATDRMGVDPAKCAYIGDQPKRDVAAAQKAGFAKSVIIRQGRKSHINVDNPFLVPDHKIKNLKELLDIFPDREPTKSATVYKASLSTMWLKDNFATLPDFFEFARRTGFSHVELNHKINSEMLEGLEMAHYPVSSLHEPCPSDIPVPTLVKQDWLISSVDEEKRRKGVDAVRRSVDLAARMGVKMIVVHPGQTTMDAGLEKQLRALILGGKKGSDEFNAIKQQMVATRTELAPAAFTAVKKSITELLEYARPHKIRLGLENRYHYREIPSPDEMETLLSLGEPELLGVTFDVGHAEHLSRLGFYPYMEWLERFSSRIFETHLHDMRGIVDHFAPGMGEVDFAQLARYLPDTAIRTCEFIDTNSPEDVISGLRYLAQNGCVQSI
jgi:HAD superfamily hydrolase (TIGR01509 family)